MPTQETESIVAASLPTIREPVPIVESDVGSKRQDDPTPETLRERLSKLESAITTLPEYDGTDAGVRRKYEGMTPRDLQLVYPILRSKRTKVMFATLDSAIAEGKNESQVVRVGESVDLTRYKAPGDSFQCVAHRTEPLDAETVEYKIVSFDRERFPEVYIRAFEETWVHDRLDEAGLDQPGNDAH